MTSSERCPDDTNPAATTHVARSLASRLGTLLARDDTRRACSSSSCRRRAEVAGNLADALVPTLSSADVAWVQHEFGARAKGELRPSASGAVRVFSAWSSTAFVASAFAPWRLRPAELPLAGLGPFSALRLEERLHIPHGGGTPNLDVALDGPEGLVGVESKLTEHLAPVGPRPWRPAYRRPAMAAALDGGWRATFEDLVAGRWAPRYLDAGQLVRHALSLRRAGHLVLVFWEPLDGEEHPEVVAHRAEVAELLERVGDAPPRLHALSWAEVLDAWAPLMPSHVAALRARYAIKLSA